MRRAEAELLAAAPLAASPRKLRVGLFADAPRQPKWLTDAFARVAASDFASVVALGVAGARGERLPRLLEAYRRLDRLAFGAEPSQPLELARQVAHQRLISSFSPPELRALDLDVCFALGAFDDRLLDGVARYGVWRFRFGTEGGASEALAGFAELARDEPATASGIQVRLAPGAPPRVVSESWSRTYPFSLARTRERFLEKTGELACRALREVQRSGAAFLERGRPAGAATAPAPAGAGLARELGALGGRVLRRALTRALHIEQWFLAFRFDGGARVSPDLGGFTRIVPPADRDWADPFPLERGGRHYVFFEELPYKTGKGHISMIELQPDGAWSAPVRVLERDYHLSYPFLLEHEGALYMIPETAQNRTVEVYRCVEFPLRWRLETALLEGVRCVDATFHRAAGRWWMFANMAPGERGAFDDELHLFHAERLFGDWQPHARNPVKSDARCARPAGKLYRRDGALYRPAQVCVPRYGAGLALHRVRRLTPQEYVEEEAQRIVPQGTDGLLGLHTVNRTGGLTLIDAFARRRRL